MFFFALSIIMYLVQNFGNKQYTKHTGESSTGVSLAQNAICTFSAAVILACFGKAKLMPPKIMLLALIFGALYLTTVFLVVKAFSLGSMGGTTLLCNTGMFISAIYGIIRFGDEFTLFIGIGVVLMFASILLSMPKDDKNQNSGIIWFTVALGSGFSNGAVASVKREAVAIFSQDSGIFLFWGFLFASAIAFALLISNKRNREDAFQVLGKKTPILYGICAGLGTAGGNLFQMLALDTVSSAIIYPLTAGFLVVSLELVSLLVYKETTLKLKNIFAVICCVSAIIIINI